ncbi:MAG: Rossmann-fold NAD(P)-binding domain-containing protein, partial [Candidatus Methanofastidiosia archaeon]
TQIVQPWDGSAAEQIEKLVPEGVEVVGAFQNVCAARLADLDNPVESDIAVCGKKEARKEIMELANMIEGVRAVNGGHLCNCRIVESITAFIIGLNIRYKKPKGMGIRFTHLDD